MSERLDNLHRSPLRRLRFVIETTFHWLSSYKRPLYACILVIATLGSVALYAYFVETLPPLPCPENILQAATGNFDVEVTPTFDVKADTAFVLKPTSVLMRLERTELMNTSEDFPAGRPFVIRNLPYVNVGPNEFWVQVHAGDAPRNAPDAFRIRPNEPDSEEDFAVTRAVRIRILRDGLPVAEHTLWSEPGEPVEGKVPITVPDDARHGHDH